MIVAGVGRALPLATVPLAYWLGVLTLAQLYVVAFLARASKCSSSFRTTRPSSRSSRARARLSARF
jgi:hypothetical protein